MSAPPGRPKAVWWTNRRFWLGVAISVVCLWLVFRNVQWVELGAAIQAVDWTILALAAFVALLDQVVRGVRWRVFLVPVGRVSAADSFSFLSIGALANVVLPLRAGEIIRAVLLGEKRQLSKSAVFGTVVVERLFDVLMLVAMALVLLAAMPIPLPVKQTVIVLGVAGLLVLLAMWWAVGQLSDDRDSRLARQAKALGQRLAGPPEQPRQLLGIDLGKWLRKGWLMAQSFVAGLGVVRTPRLAASGAAYTVLAWGASLAYIWLVLRACHLNLPWTASLMVLVLVNFGAAIPSSPGGLGVVHLLAIAALTPWNVPPSQALTFAIMVHATVLAVMVGVGLACLWWEGMGISQLAGARGQPAAAVAIDQDMTP
jgi:hypothetical protein